MTQEVHPLVDLVGPLGPYPAPSATKPAASAEVLDRPQPETPKRHQRLLGTLGARLIAGVVAVVLLVVIATGVATYLSLHSYLFGRLDKQLTNSAQGQQIQQSLTSSNRFGGTGPSPQKVWLAVLDQDGDMFDQQASNSATQQLGLSADQRRSLVANQNQHRTITATDGTELRVVAETLNVNVAIPNADGTITRQSESLVFVVGLSTDEINRTMDRLVVLELIIGAGAVLLALGATTWGVRTSLGPLKRVTRTAQEVTAELSPEGAGLDRRVPDSSRTTEVGQLASSFNTMLDTVETEFRARRESEERMRQFLADASHELRTPLTSIRGYAELERMQQARRGADPSDGDAIGRIEAEGTRMSRLVEDLLTLARGDDAANDGVVDRSAVDVGDLVGEVVSGVQAANPGRFISAQVDPGLTVQADRDQMMRLLRNLATNAAVHTDPRGAIRVEGHREGANVVLQVIDEGPGLPPDDAAHVFERFWRADKARTRVRGGSGLGMAIVAQIVEAHGGTVYFDSSVEQGSTVTVVLPGVVG